MQVHQGSKFKIVHCKGAFDSFETALEDFPQNKRLSLKRWLFVQIERLGDGVRMSCETFPKEGELPKSQGRSNGNFFALKKIPIRGYCWRSITQHNTWFISHYIVKKKNKLSSKDTALVCSNWSRIEEQGDEF